MEDGAVSKSRLFCIQFAALDHEGLIFYSIFWWYIPSCFSYIRFFGGDYIYQ